MYQVTLAHDYFLQCGGAERVAASWMDHFTTSPMYTLAYDENATFSTIDKNRVKSRMRGTFWSKHLHKLLPALPILANNVEISEGDVALVSTSGWAHQFNYSVPTVAYVHSPARWLHAALDYRMGLSSVQRTGLSISSRYLKSRDDPAMRRMRRIVCNSKVTQERVWNAYGLETHVVSPPVSPVAEKATKPASLIPDSYLLIVARNRGYKRLKDAAEVARQVGRSLVIIGSGTDVFNDPDSRIYGLGRVTDEELKWLYQHADALLATAREDFGLTVLEANAEGTPVVAVPAGGYLETVRSGVNGFLSHTDRLDSFAPAVRDAITIDSSSCRSWAESFSPMHHISQISEVLSDAAA